MTKKKAQKEGIIWKIVKLAVAAALCVFLLFSVQQRLNAPISQVEINIDKVHSKKALINKKEVRKLIKQKIGYDVNLANVSQLDLYEIELLLNEDSRINKANIFVDKHNSLFINIEQKRPIVRVNVTQGEDYYLDYKGSRIPLTETFRVPVVTGKVDQYVDGFQRIKKHNLNDVLLMAQKIYDDEFLKPLVEQIDINEKNELTIIPKVGREKILFGEVENINHKIYKLKIYYEEGIKNIGIDKFDELDLQYDGQILGRNKET